MIWLGTTVLIVLLCFGIVVLFGAPYLPTLTPQVLSALKLAGLKKGDSFLELGCGDGKVLIAAAKLGIHGIGYELNPIMAGIAWIRTRKYHKYVKIIWGDYWEASWPEADAIFVFLLPRYMKKLDTKVVQYSFKPIKLVSFAFTVPDKKPSADSDNVFLYNY